MLGEAWNKAIPYEIALFQSDNIFVSTLQGAWNVLHHACAGGSVEVLMWLIETFPGLNTDDFLNAKTMVGKIELFDSNLP